MQEKWMEKCQPTEDWRPRTKKRAHERKRKREEVERKRWMKNCVYVAHSWIAQLSIEYGRSNLRNVQRFWHTIAMATATEKKKNRSTTKRNELTTIKETVRVHIETRHCFFCLCVFNIESNFSIEEAQASRKTRRRSSRENERMRQREKGSIKQFNWIKLFLPKKKKKWTKDFACFSFCLSRIETKKTFNLNFRFIRLTSNFVKLPSVSIRLCLSPGTEHSTDCDCFE